MPFLTYRCPYMSVPVQCWVGDARDDEYETIICAACKDVRLAGGGEDWSYRRSCDFLEFGAPHQARTISRCRDTHLAKGTAGRDDFIVFFRRLKFADQLIE